MAIALWIIGVLAGLFFLGCVGMVFWLWDKSGDSYIGHAAVALFLLYGGVLFAVVWGILALIHWL